DGGGIFQTAISQNSTLTQDLLAGNSSGGKGGGVYEQGDNAKFTAMTVANTTFSGNSAVQGGGGLSIGTRGGTAGFSCDTFTGNSSAASTTAGSGGGALLLDGSSTQTGQYRGTIFAKNPAGGVDSSCSGANGVNPGPGLVDMGYNLESANSCFLNTPAANSLVNTNPLLAPLASNGVGVPTRTHG